MRQVLFVTALTSPILFPFLCGNTLSPPPSVPSVEYTSYRISSTNQSIHTNTYVLYKNSRPSLWTRTPQKTRVLRHSSLAKVPERSIISSSLFRPHRKTYRHTYENTPCGQRRCEMKSENRKVYAAYRVICAGVRHFFHSIRLFRFTILLTSPPPPPKKTFDFHGLGGRT